MSNRKSKGKCMLLCRWEWSDRTVKWWFETLAQYKHASRMYNSGRNPHVRSVEIDSAWLLPPVQAKGLYPPSLYGGNNRYKERVRRGAYAAADAAGWQRLY